MSESKGSCPAVMLKTIEKISLDNHIFEVYPLETIYLVKGFDEEVREDSDIQRTALAEKRLSENCNRLSLPSRYSQRDIPSRQYP